MPVDPLLPLRTDDGAVPGCGDGLIDAGTAYVQDALEKIMSRAIMRSFRARLRAIGVSRIGWQRQREQGVETGE